LHLLTHPLDLSPEVFTSMFFYFNDTATTVIYTLSLHDALPIYLSMFLNPDREGHSIEWFGQMLGLEKIDYRQRLIELGVLDKGRSEEHTSELQSRENLVCRLLLEKKNKKATNQHNRYTAKGNTH